METYYALAVGFILRMISSGAFLAIGFRDQVTVEKPGWLIHLLKYQRSYKRVSHLVGLFLWVELNWLILPIFRGVLEIQVETWLVSSEDDGKSWNKISKFGSNDSNEATLCSLNENRVLAAVRTHVDHHVKLCETSSSENGKKKALTLPMQHPADLTELSDNCLLLTYGIRNVDLWESVPG